jgi:hypothetical protein
LGLAAGKQIESPFWPSRCSLTYQTTGQFGSFLTRRYACMAAPVSHELGQGNQTRPIRRQFSFFFCEGILQFFCCWLNGDFVADIKTLASGLSSCSFKYCGHDLNVREHILPCRNELDICNIHFDVVVQKVLF